jgi:hypothetical protein
MHAWSLAGSVFVKECVFLIIAKIAFHASNQFHTWLHILGGMLLVRVRVTPALFGLVLSLFGSS